METEVLELSAVLPQPDVMAVPFRRKAIPALELLSPRMPGIDVLRGVAVLMVVVFHGTAFEAPQVEWGSRFLDAAYGLTAWGWLGVNLFFVISGFLITGILDGTASRRDYYKQFYMRRALRILPAYLAVLALARVTGFASSNYVGICLLFLANMPGVFLRHGYVMYWPLWSLAVEEQFYLVWPLLYQKLGRRGMLVACLVLMALCPVLRGLAFAGWLHMGDPLSKPWTIGDNLAVGAALAILIRWPGVTARQFALTACGMGAAGLAGLAMLFLAGKMGTQDVLRNSVGLSCFELVCGAAVAMAVWVFRERKVPGWMRVFVFFGEISYGLYLIHMLLLQIYDRLRGSGFETDWRLLAVRFVVANGLAVGVAVASKRWFEDPILRWKKRLEWAR